MHDHPKETDLHSRILKNKLLFFLNWSKIGVNRLVDIAVERNIEVWEGIQFDLEMTLLESDFDKVTCIELIKKRIKNLDYKSKRLRGLDKMIKKWLT